MQGSTWKVHYFPVFGRAEALRMLLTHAKVGYENVNYGDSEGAHSWSEAKASGKFEFGQLPAVEGNGKFYA